MRPKALLIKITSELMNQFGCQSVQYCHMSRSTLTWSWTHGLEWYTIQANAGIVS